MTQKDAKIGTNNKPYNITYYYAQDTKNAKMTCQKNKVVLLTFLGKYLSLSVPVPCILEELRENTASVGWKKNYPWYISYFFCRNEILWFVKIESWNFQNLFDWEVCETLQNFSSFQKTIILHFSMENKSCPNELKFCEVSGNLLSNRFQISILTNKKVLFLKKY